MKKSDTLPVDLMNLIASWWSEKHCFSLFMLWMTNDECKTGKIMKHGSVFIISLMFFNQISFKATLVKLTLDYELRNFPKCCIFSKIRVRALSQVWARIHPSLFLMGPKYAPRHWSQNPQQMLKCTLSHILQSINSQFVNKHHNL